MEKSTTPRSTKMRLMDESVQHQLSLHCGDTKNNVSKEPLFCKKKHVRSNHEYYAQFSWLIPWKKCRVKSTVLTND